MSSPDLTPKEQYREKTLDSRTMVMVFLIIALVMIFFFTAGAWKHKQSLDTCEKFPEMCQIRLRGL